MIGDGMKTNLNYEDLTYQDYSNLKSSVTALEIIGLVSDSVLLENLIEEIRERVVHEICISERYDPLLFQLENALDKRNQVIVFLKDKSVWYFDFFGLSKYILVLRNRLIVRKAFIWEVKELMIKEE